MSWTNQSKNTSIYTNQSKQSGLFYLLQEIGYYLLQENGHRIILEESIDWSKRTKNLDSWTNLNKS